jgi:hypothetical protein
MKISLPRKNQGYKQQSTITWIRQLSVNMYAGLSLTLCAAARKASISTAADAVIHAHTTDSVTTDSSDDKTTVPVTPVVALPSAAASRAPRRSWKAEEDAKLIEAVNKHGKKWVAVAAMVPGRTNQQCRYRWITAVDPADEGAGKWTPEEDANLTVAVQKHGKDGWALRTMVDRPITANTEPQLH